jgi:fructokinase
MSADLHRPAVLCFGEMLWDCLPEGRFPGGAPLNVAHHLQRLSIKAQLVSAVGRDALGSELIDWAERSGLDVRGVRRDEDLPTGLVRATLSTDGDASYEIACPAAWDRIELTEPTEGLAASAAAIVFGSLAHRSTGNWDTLSRLLVRLPVTAERVFDVNLRPPYDDLAVVRRLAKRATLLKANADEAARLCADVPAAGREQTHARYLANEFHLDSICITAGARGAGLLDYDHWYWHRAAPVPVRDTIGAGDAFLAGLLAARLQGKAPAQSLRDACRLAETAVSHAGATVDDSAARPAIEVPG